MNNDWGFDLETYPNVFTATFIHVDSGISLAFVVSPWCNDSVMLLWFLQWLRESRARMVGFNSLGFDYPIIHMLMKMGQVTAQIAYQKAQAIIDTQWGEDGDESPQRWQHMVYPGDRFIEQIDLFKIHHFDNKARATSLKVLEFNMRSETVEELPFPVGTELTEDQVPVLLAYNYRDTAETIKFYKKSTDMVRFREELTAKYQRDFMNHNDVKIGRDYFLMELEKVGVTCYEYGPNGRTPKQTKRSHIVLRDAILPWLNFETPEFQRIVTWMRDQVITETKGVFKNLTALVDGVEYTFGTGGLHGSIDDTIIETNDQYQILDIDVEGYYPSTGIAQRFKPEHLPEKFCDIWGEIKAKRKEYPKGTAENAMLKLASNGPFGDTNSKFSPFFDPLTFCRITLNGQFLQALLIENLRKVHELKVIQSNTDGITVYIRRDTLAQVLEITKAWETLTKLTLEYVNYSKMFIRDCNNYVALREDGKVKRKGAYEYKLEWHQNHSALVVPKVAEQVLLHGASIRDAVMNWSDPMDFLLRTKVPRSSHLVMEINGQPYKLQNVTRYYIAQGGGRLFKWMPALKGKTDWRKIGVESGWGVQVCNNLRDMGTLPIDHDYYIRECEKLILGLR